MFTEVDRIDEQTVVPGATVRYRRIRLLKPTQMSEVWLAQKSDGALVVLKIALAHKGNVRANLDAIRNEVKWRLTLQQQLGQTSCGIVQLLPAVEDAAGRPLYYAQTMLEGRKTLFLVMPYLAGGTLQALVDPIGKAPTSLPVQQALTIIAAIARTVAQLHNQACVHLDLKPQNIMFHQRPRVGQPIRQNNLVIIDIGLAQKVGESLARSVSTKWAAPERLTAKAQRTPVRVQTAMDIYSLGLILRYLLTGVHPRNLSQAQLRRPLTATDLRFAPQTTAEECNRLTDHINRLLQWALALDPTARPTAVSFAAAAESLYQPQQCWISRRALLICLLVGLCCLLWFAPRTYAVTVRNRPILPDRPSALPWTAPLSVATSTMIATSTVIVTASVLLTPPTLALLPVAEHNSRRPTPTLVKPTATLNRPTPVAPAAKPTATLRPTLLPSPTLPVAPPITRPPAQPATAGLIIPSRGCNNDTWLNEVVITWKIPARFRLRPGQKYELVAWDNPNANPLSPTAAPGLVSTVAEPLIRFQAATVLHNPHNVVKRAGTPYFYGILLIQETPYRRLQLLTPTPCRFNIDPSHE